MVLKILAIDDEPAILDLIDDTVSSDGHIVIKAGSLAQAYKCLAAETVDIMIVDIGLADGSGLDLVQDIRNKFDGWIIIVSGRGDVSDRVVGIELGADDYVVKPFSIRELRARIAAVHRRLSDSDKVPHQPVAKLHSFCGYEIDPVKRTVTRSDGEDLHLTTREFDVLLVLLENRERVLKREAIVLLVFGEGHEVGGRPVDGLISRLREKLFPDGTGALRIKTIHGRGYQLSA